MSTIASSPSTAFFPLKHYIVFALIPLIGVCNLDENFESMFWSSWQNHNLLTETLVL